MCFIKTIKSTRPAVVSQCKEVRNRIYTDVTGPFRDESIGNFKYFVTLINNFSGYSVVKFINFKSDAAETVKDMMTSLENLCQKSTKLSSLKTGSGVKHLRSDWWYSRFSNRLRARTFRVRVSAGDKNVNLSDESSKSLRVCANV